MKYFLIFLATNRPAVKKIIIERVVPFPLPNSEPINIKKNIMLDEKILKLIPIIVPIIKKEIMNKVFPNPIPKCEPTNAM